MNDQIVWIILKRLRAPFIVLILTFSIAITGLVLIPGTDNAGNVYHMTFFDAFYFVSYMASTIGFGEAPYTFNYQQRIWVSLCIYITVIGWFYGIGAIVALVQDESLKKAIERNRFRKQILRLGEPFYIIFGYNIVTKSIINRLNGNGYRIVVLERDEDKIDELMLENFYPQVPTYLGNATRQNVLKIAGIHQRNCVGVISLFEDDMKNSQIATLCQLLNKKIDIIVKATSPQQVEHFENMGLDHIKNPFQIISKRLYYSITAPHIWLLEMWMYGQVLKLRKKDYLPHGRYMVCGHGRMGQAIIEGLERAGIEYVCYNINSYDYKKKHNTMIFGSQEDVDELLELGIKDVSCIIAATQDDLFNLTLINKAKQLNPNLYTIARENSLEEYNIFRAAKIDRIYVVEKVLADATYNFIARPLADIFIQEVRKRDEEWAEVIVNLLNNITGMNPHYFEKKIDKEEAYALSVCLENKESITLADIRRSRENNKDLLKLVYLLLKRGDEVFLMPDSSMEIQVGDELLVVADDETYDDFEYIINNYYELEYALEYKKINNK
jgi:Trk K+ transport system NAD-binding subunit